MLLYGNVLTADEMRKGSHTKNIIYFCSHWNTVHQHPSI